MASTERYSDRKREEKWQTCWCGRDQQRACRMAQASAENFNKLGLLKRKEWPQCHRTAVGKNAGAALAKRKRKRAISQEYQIMRGERVKVGESRILVKERNESG